MLAKVEMLQHETGEEGSLIGHDVTTTGWFKPPPA